jgi:trehalose/maltose hydrolase-like predicted phosphorylase
MWIITEDSFIPQKQHHMETLFTIGNGYLCTRGATEEIFPDNRRATFIHGIFDDVPLVFTELVNAPDWLPLGIYLDGERFSMDRGSIQEYKRQLDLKTGLLTRKVRWVSPSGKGVHLTFERFTSLDDEHLLCQRVRAIPDFDGQLEFRASLNGYTENEGFAHWRWVNQVYDQQGLVSLHLCTRTTATELALAMRLETSGKPDSSSYCDTENMPMRTLTFSARRGEAITLEKFVGIASSRDTANPSGMAQQHARQPVSWDSAFEVHRQAWQREWERMDIIVEGDEEAQLAIRFSLYQLFIAAPRNDDRVNIGAKTLSGFGYRGHSFWDTETFMLPVFIYTSPLIARNLLNYRYQRLPAAREKARQNGFEGAQFPWESADTGEEVTPTWVPHFSDRKKSVRIWTGDIEIHISADIAFAANLYWRVTGDNKWFIEKGAELVLDTAKFWAARAEWNPETGYFEYNDVIGPDEYHEHVNNNFFTNYLARWNLKAGLSVLEWLKKEAPEKAEELIERLDLNAGRLEAWQKVIQAIFLPEREDGLIEQFKGYFERQDVHLADLEPREISAQVLFGIEGCNQTQVLKQPDALMLIYMMRDEFDQSRLRVNYDYYTPRTDLTYGSSLGLSIQAILACELGDSQAAYEHFLRAARADLYDVRGNASDGIHGASAGGVWQAIAFGFAGLQLTGDHWEVKPCLPAHWKRLSFQFMHHGQVQTVDIYNP